MSKPLERAKYPPATIVNTILKLAADEKKEITHLQLQKILYFAHAWYLAFYNKPLINNPFAAYKYGPVCEVVYQEYKGFGDSPIEYETRNLMGVIQEDVHGSRSYVQPLLEQSEDLEHLEKVWNSYKMYSGLQLSNMTHNKNPHIEADNPWAETRELALEQGVEEGYDLKNTDIQEYFKELKKADMKF